MSPVSTEIVCDNPDCPGNTLDPHDRVVWFYVSITTPPPRDITEPPTVQYVYCTKACARTVPMMIS
jgi:hypothetical protein